MKSTLRNEIEIRNSHAACVRSGHHMPPVWRELRLRYGETSAGKLTKAAVMSL